MNPCITPPKKRRGKARVSVLFASLEKGDSFYLRPTLRAVKTSFCTARPYAKAALSATDWGKQTPAQFVNPFRSVFIDRPPEDPTVKAWTGILRGGVFPAGASETIRPVCGPTSAASPGVTLGPVNDGITHYVGDDCPGGHKDLDQPHVE